MFYVNIGYNLAKNIPHSSMDPTSYISHTISSTLFIEHADEEEVTSIIKLLKISSPGWDEIPSKVVKASYQSFIAPFTHIVNLSLQQGVVLKLLMLYLFFRLVTRCLYNK